MSRIIVLLAGIMLALGAMISLPGYAGAVTHAPCTGHSASVPYVDVINGDGTSTLTGSGGISGCPLVTTTKSESVTLTVCLQRFVNGAWADQVCAGPVTKGWNRYWRYARSNSLTVYATCVPGDWRTDVRGGDGFAPTEWNSSVATFVPGDSGVCGAYGGGD
jgi:hypothetical protein